MLVSRDHSALPIRRTLPRSWPCSLFRRQYWPMTLMELLCLPLGVMLIGALMALAGPIRALEMFSKATWFGVVDLVGDIATNWTYVRHTKAQTPTDHMSAARRYPSLPPCRRLSLTTSGATSQIHGISAHYIASLKQLPISGSLCVISSPSLIKTNGIHSFSLSTSETTIQLLSTHPLQRTRASLQKQTIRPGPKPNIPIYSGVPTIVCMN